MLVSKIYTISFIFILNIIQHRQELEQVEKSLKESIIQGMSKEHKNK